MIRIVLITLLTLILVTVLYTPSVIPPDAFVNIIKRENAVHRAVWGDDVANRILLRLLELQQVVPNARPDGPPVAVPVNARPGDPQAAMANQVNEMGARLFANPYFKSIDGLVTLATYRLCALVELLPVVLVALFVALIDGLVVRRVRAKEFIAHSAEAFSASVIGGICIAAGLILSVFLPFSLHPMFIASAVVVMLFILSRALANYHLIGR